MSTSPLDVLIVGAGLGGLAAAISIAEAGHRVVVADSNEFLAEIGAGIQLGPQTINVLKRWGINDDLLPFVVATEAIRLIRYDGTRDLLYDPHFRDGLNREYGSPLYALHRTDFQRALYKKALSLGVSFRFGAQVASIDGARGAVKLKSGEELHASLVVGADGLHSVARDSLVGHPDPALPTGELAYRAVLIPKAIEDDVELREAILTGPKTLRVYFGPDSHVVVYPLGNGELNMVICVPDDLPPHVSRQPGDLQEMRALYQGWDPLLLRLLDKVDKADKWRLRSHPGLPTWHHPSGKLVLLGDAVHPMLPYLAQGANSAIIDGVVLGECLKRISSAAEVPRALVLYESIVKPRGEFAVAKSLQQKRYFNMHDGPEQVARDATFARNDRRGDFPFLILSPDAYGVLAAFDPYAEVERQWSAAVPC